MRPYYILNPVDPTRLVEYLKSVIDHEPDLPDCQLTGSDIFEVLDDHLRVLNSEGVDTHPTITKTLYSQYIVKEFNVTLTMSPGYTFNRDDGEPVSLPVIIIKEKTPQEKINTIFKMKDF